jgi:D-alanyl-D-alanine carboxypeptidase (penicillin-binding protein 5/6)
VPGTSACLEAGERYRLWDLLHGMMLPSGNDAAMAIAIAVGRHENPGCKWKDALKWFVDRMNESARLHSLWSTNFANPHGLSHPRAHSTCHDMAKLCLAAAENPTFLKIVEKRTHVSRAIFEDEVRKVTWKNTNRLLRYEGFKGFKTGVTLRAGPCLAALFESRGLRLVIVLLKSANLKQRFIEARQLVEHTLLKLGRPGKVRRLPNTEDSDYFDDEEANTTEKE